MQSCSMGCEGWSVSLIINFTAINVNQGRREVTGRRWRQQLPDDIKETRILETELQITRLTSVENWHYQWLQTSLKTDYGTNER